MAATNISQELYKWTDTSNDNTSYMFTGYNSSYIYNDDRYSYMYPDTDSDSLFTIYNNLKCFTYVFLGLQTIVGVIGNIISLIVWMKGNECSSIACSVYFKLLAASDIFTLLSGCWRHVIFERYFAHHKTLAICIMNDFICFYAPQLSSWLVVCISAERFLSLTFPFSFQSRGAKTRAKVAFIVLIVVLFGINSNVFFLEFEQQSGVQICTFSQNDTSSAAEYYKTMFVISSMWMLIVIPFCLIMTCNILILIQLCTKRRANILNKKQSKQRVAMFTKFALCSGVLLAISLLPSLLYQIVDTYGLVEITLENWLALHFSSNNTFYLNNCLNFLVYCYSSTQFRSDLRRLCVRQRPVFSTSSHNTRTTSVEGSSSRTTRTTSV